MTKISIHKALSELKLLDKRIRKSIENFIPLGAKTKTSKVNNFKSEVDFNKDAKEDYQSILDLIQRRKDLKSAIISSNASTEVVVGGIKMKVAEAIDYKQVIDYRKMLLKNLKYSYSGIKASIEDSNAKVEANALSVAKETLKKDNVKIGDNDAVQFTKPYIEYNEFHLVDPLGAEEQIKKLEEEIDNFEAEVDAVLSESNSLTIIDV